MKNQSCYYCGAPSTGMDHVPPKAFFPESKDRPPGSPDLRKGLLRVPACDAHNNKVSRDDQIAMQTMLVHESINAVGRLHQTTKLRRAWTRDPTLAHKVLPRGREELSGPAVDGAVVTIDVATLNRVLDRVAKGLFYHEHGTRWTEQLAIVSGSLMMEGSGLQPYELPMRGLLGAAEGRRWRGENPAVFRYQWLSASLLMVFYGAVDFAAVPLRRSARSVVAVARGARS